MIGWKGYKTLKKIISKNSVEIDKNPTLTLNNNVMGFDGNIKDFMKNQLSILGKLKYLIFYPLVKTLHFCFRKKLASLKDKPDHLYLFNMFEKAWDKSGIVWCDVFVWDVDRGNPSKFINHYMTCISYKSLSMVKDLIMLMGRYDSAYLEFMNIFLLELHKVISDEVGEFPAHVLYKNKLSVNDPQYFVVNTYQNRLQLKDRVRRVKEYVDKEGVLKVKNLGGAKNILARVSAELNTTPDMVEETILSLLHDNNNLYNLLNSTGASIGQYLQGKQR